jgi:hypothetical protein
MAFSYFGGRDFEQLRRRRRIRHSGRCEPQQGRAGGRRQSKFRRINRCRRRGGCVSSKVPRRPPGQARRPSCTSWLSSGPIRARRASCCDAKSKVSKLSSSWSNLFRRRHGRKSPYPRRDKNPNLIGAIIPTGAGIRLPGDGPSLVTGPRRTPRELEIKGAVRHPD